MNLNPAFEFFLFKQDISKSAELQSSLIQIVDEGLFSDLKQEISELTYYLNYFDYIHFVKYLLLGKEKTDDDEVKFPPEVLEMARNTH